MPRTVDAGLLLGIKLFGHMHALGLFVVVGIALDDLFVVHDHVVRSLRAAAYGALAEQSGRIAMLDRRVKGAQIGARTRVSPPHPRRLPVT